MEREQEEKLFQSPPRREKTLRGKNRDSYQTKTVQGKKDLQKKLNLVKFVLPFVTFVVQEYSERKS
jgi:hypothetical protein